MTDTQALFNRIARHYDALNNWLSWGQHWIWKHMVIGWVDPQPGETAVDLCCGTGDLTGLLARKLGKTGQVWGIDFAEAMLAIARRRYAHWPIRWHQGDVMQLPFPDATVDVVTMGYGLRNLRTGVAACGKSTGCCDQEAARRFWIFINRRIRGCGRGKRGTYSRWWCRWPAGWAWRMPMPTSGRVCKPFLLVNSKWRGRAIAGLMPVITPLPVV